MPSHAIAISVAVWAASVGDSPRERIALKVSGQSMVDAGINSGDVVIVRQQPLAEHREIVVALLNGEATIKRLHHRDGQIRLLPENHRFKPIPIGPDDDLRILGKVVAVRRAAGK